jgi:hypothetical protein
VCVHVSCFLLLFPQLPSYVVVVVALKSSSSSSIRQSRFFPSLISNNINMIFGCCLERFEQASECLCAKSSCRETAGKHRTIFHERLLADFRGRVQMSRGKYANVIISSVSNDSGAGERSQSIQLAPYIVMGEFFFLFRYRTRVVFAGAIFQHSRPSLPVSRLPPGVILTKRSCPRRVQNCL